jgi:hypothetical protein
VNLGTLSGEGAPSLGKEERVRASKAVHWFGEFSLEILECGLSNTVGRSLVQRGSVEGHPRGARVGPGSFMSFQGEHC